MGGKPSTQRSATVRPRSQPQPAPWSRFLPALTWRVLRRKSAPTKPPPVVGELSPIPTSYAGLAVEIIPLIAEVGPTEALEYTGTYTSTQITPQDKSKRQQVVKGSGGPAVYGDAKPKADNGFAVLPDAREVQLESLTVTNAAGDTNLTINNYYLSPQPEASPGIPLGRSPPRPGPSTPSISNELVGGCHELGAADSLKAADTDNNYFAIGQRCYQDLHERVELLESAVFQSTHSEHPIANRDRTAGGHDTVVSTSGATPVSGTDGTITPAPGMVVPASGFGATLGTPLPSAPPYSLLPHTTVRPARRANTDGGAPISQRPSLLGD